MPSIRERIVADATLWVGTLYKWGGDDETEGGVDCSGLVIDAYADAGVPLSGRPVARDFASMGRSISLTDALPADVLYFDNPGTSTDHVALYIGDGMMIEAPTVGEKVKVAPVRTPTSVRRLPQAVSLADPGKTSGGARRGGIDVWDFVPGYQGGELPGEEDDALAVDLFPDWSAGALRVGLFVVGALMAGGLVVAGVMNTVKEG